MIHELLLAIYVGIHFYVLGGTWGSSLFSIYVEGPDRLLLGLMIHYVIIGSVNLFLPVGLWTTVALTCLICITQPQKAGHLMLAIWSGGKPLIWGLAIFILLVPYWSGLVLLYDHYLYHDQSVKWFHAFAVPAGLVNFHGRLGFNHGFFPIISSIQTGLDSHWYFMNSGLFTLFLFKSAALIRRPTVNGWLRMAIIIFTCSIVCYAHPYLSGISPDLQVTLLTAYLVTTIATDGWTIRQPGFMLSLLVFMLVTKVNMAIFVAIMTLFILWKYHKQPYFFKLLWLPFMIGLVWVVRSLLLTGQLLYPFQGLYIGFFSYSVPLFRVEEMHDMIVGWARSPGPGYLERYEATREGFAWVKHWYAARTNHAYTHLPGDIRISLRVLLWLVVSVSAWSVLWLVIKRQLLSLPGLFVMAFTANLIFWFLTGPDFRFAFPLFQALFFVVMVAGVGGSWMRWMVLCFLMMTLPFQLKDVGREYAGLVFQLSDASWTRGRADKSVGTSHMREAWIPSHTGTDSFRYVYPEQGDKSRLDVFPAAPARLDHVVFVKSGWRLEFQER